MKLEFEQILITQKEWSSSNTVAMQQRGLLIRTILPALIRESISVDAEKYRHTVGDLRVEGRDGTGLKNENPWVRIYSAVRSPKATEGWYLVLLFDAFGNGVSLSINQGTTRWANGEYVPRPVSELKSRAQWARTVLEPEASVRGDLSGAISLPTRRSRLAKGYEQGNVFALIYEGDALPSDETLYGDIAFMLGLLVTLYEDIDNTLMVPGEPAPEIIDAEFAADFVAGRTPRGGKFRMTAAERRAIELRAVSQTMQFLEAEGYKVKDVGAVESYDLDATRGDHHLYVEVKGTVSGGDKVILTRNEVALHRKHFPHNMLAIVSNIELDRNGSMPVATGGTLRVVSPWDIDESRLEPLSYDYKVPGEETKLR